MNPKERWSRNCGSGGIGHSGYNTEFKSGVLISNWVEDLAKSTGPLSDTILTHSAPLRGPPTSTQRLHYTEAGKTGAELLEGCERHDLYQLGIKGELLTRHGRFDQPPVQCLGTTYQMTHGRVDGTDRRVQSYLWHGNKRNDMYVPHSTMGPQSCSLTTRKLNEWGAGGAPAHDPYQTTQRATTLPPALATAEAPPRAGTLRPLADSGMLQHPGQRPKGETRDELDKNYRQIGLRVNYRS
ncbi:hypothetical protein GPECTOR_11g177 [Gonium pectorale]|uniref:Flagellar associated protein n=1 Tax=Gonium pectorale TaxID=33097 RepID=A0A150GQV4_GONPE|nr:hypothetical protein GPECTOR_11g177 [Gonium pectorale]|eukprot:KXZ51730.1 hypothetical protein GPECTOR_11g177 [Gonium pectorale]